MTIGMEASEGHKRTVLAKQLAMNRQSWSALQQHGATEDTDLRLDFFYNAPNERAARALAAYLNGETDYEVRVGSAGGGLLKKKAWVVTGTTRDTKVSQEILDQWVEWMVLAGFENRCEFDGWGAPVPKAP